MIVLRACRGCRCLSKVVVAACAGAACAQTHIYKPTTVHCADYATVDGCVIAQALAHSIAGQSSVLEFLRRLRIWQQTAPLVPAVVGQNGSGKGELRTALEARHGGNADTCAIRASFRDAPLDGADVRGKFLEALSSCNGSVTLILDEMQNRWQASRESFNWLGGVVAARNGTWVHDGSLHDVSHTVVAFMRHQSPDSVYRAQTRSESMQDARGEWTLVWNMMTHGLLPASESLMTVVDSSGGLILMEPGTWPVANDIAAFHVHNGLHLNETCTWPYFASVHPESCLMQPTAWSHDRVASIEFVVQPHVSAAIARGAPWSLPASDIKHPRNCTGTPSTAVHQGIPRQEWNPLHCTLTSGDAVTKHTKRVLDTLQLATSARLLEAITSWQTDNLASRKDEMEITIFIDAYDDFEAYRKTARETYHEVAATDPNQLGQNAWILSEAECKRHKLQVACFPNSQGYHIVAHAQVKWTAAAGPLPKHLVLGHYTWSP